MMIENSVALEKQPGLSAETANFITHGIGFLLAIAACVHLFSVANYSADSWQMLGCYLFGISLVALYGASTLSHSFEDQSLRDFFRMMDQVCIFLLIAGSYSPFALTFLRDGWLVGLLIAMWSLAGVGILFKLCFKRLDNVATGTYLLMGWLPVIAIGQILTRLPTPTLLWIFVGGMCYTIGTFFLTFDHKHRYFHAVWHVLVIAGSACHYFGVISFMQPVNFA